MNELPADLASTVRRALSEDIGSGDITAELLPAGQIANASILCREHAVLCGTAWFNEVFRQLDENIDIEWLAADGDHLHAGQYVCTLTGPVRPLLSGERTALNFLQLLSGTATVTASYQRLLDGTKAILLDTRKTLPGLRSAQKYAVTCGGGQNHRMGLYDAILIKENHVTAAGNIATAVTNAKKLHRHVETEVKTLDELQQALEAGTDRILLDNFNIESIKAAVEQCNGRALLEVSGGVDRKTIRAVAATGVDYVSVGALTKHVRAIDYSMQIR